MRPLQGPLVQRVACQQSADQGNAVSIGGKMQGQSVGIRK